MRMITMMRMMVMMMRNAGWWQELIGGARSAESKDGRATELCGAAWVVPVFLFWPWFCLLFSPCAPLHSILMIQIIVLEHMHPNHKRNPLYMAQIMEPWVWEIIISNINSLFILRGDILHSYFHLAIYRMVWNDLNIRNDHRWCVKASD